MNANQTNPEPVPADNQNPTKGRDYSKNPMTAEERAAVIAEIIDGLKKLGIIPAEDGHSKRAERSQALRG